MPRYYFDVHDGSASRDEDGSMLSGEREARIEAVRMAGALLSDDATEVWKGAPWSISVRGAEGHVLFSLVFMVLNRPANDRTPS